VGNRDNGTLGENRGRKANGATARVICAKPAGLSNESCGGLFMFAATVLGIVVLGVSAIAAVTKVLVTRIRADADVRMTALSAGSNTSVNLRSVRDTRETSTLRLPSANLKVPGASAELRSEADRQRSP